MNLLDLDAEWLMFEGRRVGFIFRSPTNRDWWQTCFVEKFSHFKGRDGTYDRAGDDAGSPDSQCGIVKDCAPAAGSNFQMCNVDHQWSVEGGIENASLSTITVTPSLDGSKGGLWHGFVTNGQIVGGL
jgi:hypothetical protein